jgi:hypothetical protein
MSPSSIERIQREFWPGQEGQFVFAVLDGARDRRIYSSLVNTYQETACLYRGELSPQAEANAPHLVRLDYQEKLTSFLLEHGWGNSWGIFFRCDDSFDAVRRHLRHFLRVQDEAGNKLVFRYYDPRVLRDFLPTCQPNELETFFGPIRKFWLEDSEPESLLEFTLDRSSQLQTRLIALDTEAAAGR